MVSIWSFLTPKRPCRSFALREYDLNCLNGKLKDKVLFKNLSLRGRLSFSGI